MNHYSKNDITTDEIETVIAWYINNGQAKSKLKKLYYKRKGANLRKKLGWKFYTILQEMLACIKEEGA